MTQSNTSFKKVAVLTGLTVLVGGAEISAAEAATLTQTDLFILSHDVTPSGVANDSVTFSQFDSSLGTLTGVTFDLVSTVNTETGGDMEVQVATLKISGNTLDTNSFSPSGPYNFTGDDGLIGGALTLAFYQGLGDFSVDLSLDSTAESSAYGYWQANFAGGNQGLTLTYEYTPNATPLPGALPLFATGLAGLSFIGWAQAKGGTPDDRTP